MPSITPMMIADTAAASKKFTHALLPSGRARLLAVSPIDQSAPMHWQFALGSNLKR
jgi:hypothetical protein